MRTDNSRRYALVTKGGRPATRRPRHRRTAQGRPSSIVSLRNGRKRRYPAAVKLLRPCTVTKPRLRLRVHPAQRQRRGPPAPCRGVHIVRLQDRAADRAGPPGNGAADDPRRAYPVGNHGSSRPIPYAAMCAYPSIVCLPVRSVSHEPSSSTRCRQRHCPPPPTGRGGLAGSRW